MREPSEYVLERLAFNEERVSDCLKEIRETRAFLNDSLDVLKLLGSERLRIVTALYMTRNKKEAYKLLKMNERTFYRKLKEHGL